MVTRIRRNATVDNTKAIEGLMKSISNAQDAMVVASAIIKTGTSDLYDLMKTSNLSAHAIDGIIATLYRPAGRSSTLIDPFAFRKAVPEDKAFYSAVTISVTKAKDILPKKVLNTISVVKPAVAGEETVKVSRG